MMDKETAKIIFELLDSVDPNRRGMMAYLAKMNQAVHQLSQIINAEEPGGNVQPMKPAKDK